MSAKCRDPEEFAHQMSKWEWMYEVRHSGRVPTPTELMREYDNKDLRDPEGERIHAAILEVMGERFRPGLFATPPPPGYRPMELMGSFREAQTAASEAALMEERERTSQEVVGMRLYVQQVEKERRKNEVIERFVRKHETGAPAPSSSSVSGRRAHAQGAGRLLVGVRGHPLAL